MIKKFSWNGHIEKAELVKKFDDIKIGKIYWEENCSNCGGLHRAISIKYLNSFIYKRNNGEVFSSDAFLIMPGPKCCSTKYSSLTRNGFELSKIYCVINEIKDINKEIEQELLDKKLFVNS